MRIGIDLRPLRTGSSGGLVQLTDGLCRSLFVIAPDDQFVIFRTTASHQFPGPLPPNVTTVCIPGESEPAALDHALAADRVDVLFRPFPIDDALEFPDHRRVVLVPDLQHDEHPEHFSADELSSRRRAFSTSINQGGAVALLSQHAKERLLAHYPAARARLVLVPPGPPFQAPMLAAPLSEAETRLLPTERFFLYPANLWPHKNHQRLILAFKRFLAHRPEPWSLVLTGDDFTGQDQLMAPFRSLPVRHLGFVSARLLAELYRRCTALTYLSLYEGFGIPLLEAFQLGAPVLCSNTTSLLEVGCDATLQCDPTDIEAMASMMQRLADSPVVRAELRQLGFERVKRYEWDRSAGDLLAAMRDLAREPMRRDAAPDTRAWPNRVPRTAPRAQGLPTLEAETHTEPVLCDQQQRITRSAANTAEDEGLLVSVIIPLADHRGQALASVRSWATTQTFPRDRYEVIVMSDGSEPALNDQIRALLHPQDRLIVGPADSEARLYDLGARSARGRWLFFTEAHCFGDRRCLDAMVSYLEWSGLDGASARSQGIADNYLSRMEEQVFHDAAAYRLAPGHWNKIFMRGSALSRELYLLAGGLTWRYGLFAEPDLAARLYAMGCKMGHASAAVVRHVNTRTVEELRGSVHDYGSGECQYLLEHPDGEGDPYFGTPEWWRQRSLLDPGVDHYLWRSLSQSLLQPGSDWPARQSRWLKLLPAVVLGRRWRVFQADWTVWQAEARCWWWRNQDDRLLPAYRELWPSLARQAGVRTLAAAPPCQTAESGAPRDTFDVADLSESWHTGLHAVEALDGDRFRWSSPVACLKLPLTPDTHILRLDTRGLRPEVPMTAFLNGHRLRHRDVQTEAGEVQLALRRKHFRRGPFQYLVLICEPLQPWVHGVPDQRELGLPLFRISSVKRAT